MSGRSAAWRRACLGRTRRRGLGKTTTKFFGNRLAHDASSWTFAIEHSGEHLIRKPMSSLQRGYIDEGRKSKTDNWWEISKMQSGDAQRTWFPEMVARLQSKWHEGVSMPTLISLRDELDGMLQRIRTGRNIQTPIITCRRCGTTGRAAAPHVSVRALILALGRFEIASKDQTRALEKAWAEYRKQHRLDIEGRVPSRVPGTCPH